MQRLLCCFSTLLIANLAAAMPFPVGSNTQRDDLPEGFIEQQWDSDGLMMHHFGEAVAIKVRADPDVGPPAFVDLDDGGGFSFTLTEAHHFSFVHTIGGFNSLERDLGWKIFLTFSGPGVFFKDQRCARGDDCVGDSEGSIPSLLGPGNYGVEIDGDASAPAAEPVVEVGIFWDVKATLTPLVAPDPAPIPEPTTWTLMALGLVGMMGWRRWKGIGRP